VDAEESKIMGGVALRLKLSPALGIEGSIHYRQEKYAGEMLTVRSWPVMVTGLIYPLPILYGAIGAGWYNTTFDYNQTVLEIIEDETTQEFGWHFGVGLELPLGRRTKLSGDIRYVFLDYKFESLPGADDLKSDFYVISAGIFFGL
jgi:outer membrane protein W